MFRIWLLFLNLAQICLAWSYTHPDQELEALKRLLLNGLNLKNEPDMSKINTTVQEMQRMLMMYHRQEKLLKVSRFKSTAEHTEEDLKKMFVFTLPQMSLSDLHSATLRLSLQPNCSGTLHLLQHNRLVSTFNLSTNQSVEFDLFRTVSQWFRQPDDNRSLTIESTNYQSIPSEAILDVVSHRRKKREIKNKRSKCKKNHDCCLKKIKINFKDIGWNWIHRPESFDFYFCKGKCRRNTLLSQNALIRSILRNRNVKVPRLCCVPKKTGSLRILHYTDSNPPELAVRKMRGMVVKSCGCL